MISTLKGIFVDREGEADEFAGFQAGGSCSPAPSESFNRARARFDGELQMLFLEDSRRHQQTRPRRAEHRRGIAHAERFQLQELIIERPIHFRQVEPSVNAKDGLEILRSQYAARMLLKSPNEFRN